VLLADGAIPEGSEDRCSNDAAKMSRLVSDLLCVILLASGRDFFLLSLQGYYDIITINMKHKELSIFVLCYF
jgi:hypothetical protein